MPDCCLDEVEFARQQQIFAEAKAKGIEVIDRLTPRMVGVLPGQMAKGLTEALELVCTAKKSRIAGRAKLYHGTVEINCWLIEDEVAFRDTALHEVAHHVTTFLLPKAADHGPEWKIIAAAMGANPKAVAHGMKSEKARQLRRGVHWIATCERGHKLHLGPKNYRKFVADPSRFRCPRDWTRVVQVEPDVPDVDLDFPLREAYHLLCRGQTRVALTSYRRNNQPQVAAVVHHGPRGGVRVRRHRYEAPPEQPAEGLHRVSRTR